MKLVQLIVILLVTIGVGWLNYNYVWSYGFLGSDYCKVLGDQGYFEDEYDTASHKNCTIGLREGPEECNFIQKKILSEERQQQHCFNYDSYDDECEHHIDMRNYGMRCTWMSLGYMSAILSIMLWVVVVVNIFYFLSVLVSKPDLISIGVKNETN